MSRENVELVRRSLEAWSSGDLDATLAFVDPEVEYRPTGLFPGIAPVYHGHDGFKRFWNDFRGPWEEIEFVPERLVDHGDRVVACGRFKARGRQGITVIRELGIVFTIRDGLGARIEGYPSGEQALEAAGLHEQVEPQGNLDVARSWIEAYNRRDLEGLLAVTHPDFEFRTSGAFPDVDPVYQGHAGFQRFYGEFSATWEFFSVSVDELRDLGPRALLLGMFEGRGREGLEVRRQTASVWTFRDGLVFRIWNYEGWREAINAVGGQIGAFGPTPPL